jgi:heat shock protein HslJ
MSSKIMLLFSILFTLLTTQISAEPIDLDNLSGSWHLRVLDGGEVRKARAILDFDTKHMKLNGFDGCNRISGNLEKDISTQHLSAHLISTKMACRENIHSYVSKKLHETISEGFSIKEEKKYGIEGITLKSSKHELFFKRMEGKSDWF